MFRNKTVMNHCQINIICKKFLWNYFILRFAALLFLQKCTFPAIKWSLLIRYLDIDSSHLLFSSAFSNLKLRCAVMASTPNLTYLMNWLTGSYRGRGAWENYMHEKMRKWITFLACKMWNGQKWIQRRCRQFTWIGVVNVNKFSQFAWVDFTSL